MVTQVTQARTVPQHTARIWTLVGATAAGIALLGGAALWPLRPSAVAPAPPTTSIATASAETLVPRGGLAEQEAEVQRARATRAAARVTTRGGRAEQLADEAAEARRAAALDERRGGMAELYAEQARTAVGRP